MGPGSALSALHLHDGVIVVPPMEAVWLAGAEWELRDGRGCLSFEVKGNNDATVLLKTQSGSRRWQHLAGSAAAAQDGGGAPAGNGAGAAAAPAAAGGGRAGASSPVEQNYTVILGSHRNSCMKFEKDGELCCMVANAPGATLSAATFSRYWLNYDRGSISIGLGEPGENLCYCWTDPEPIEGIRFAGLSAWDKHVAYRNLRMHPVLHPPPSSPPPKQQRAASSAALDGDAAWSEPAAAAAPAPAPSAPPSLLDCCQAALLRGLRAASVCDLLQVADSLAPVLDGLRARAVEYAAQSFSAVAEQDPGGFCALATATLAEVLCSQSLDCPEKAVFDAVMVWAGYGAEVAGAASACHPMADLDDLLPCIRFPLMRDEELAAVGRHAMCQRSALLQELLREALDARQEDSGHRAPHGSSSHGSAAARRGALGLHGTRHVRALTASERLASTRFQARRAPGCTELLYMFDGDHNGVCWHLGTAGGSQPWVNPVLAGRVQVRASSPACRSTDPRALAGTGFARCNFAGPRMEAGQLATWWELDLGPGHQLICNHYSLRHDASPDCLRCWVLQGSNDGASWADLRRHISDRTLRMPGQYASWPVTSHAAAVPYRRFRLLLVGPNPEAPNPHHMCLSWWELYGYLYRRPEAEASPAAAPAAQAAA